MSSSAKNELKIPQKWSLGRLVKRKKSAQLPTLTTIPLISPLPVELWIIVFSHLYEGIGIRYDRVDCVNYPLYRKRLLAPEYMEQEINAFGRDCRNVRLVCRAWASFLPPTPEIILRTGEEQLNPDVRTALVSGIANTTNLIRQIERSPLNTSNLTTLIIWIEPIASWEDPMEVILWNHKLFPAVRSISFDQPERFHNFWDRLGNAFPDLISLTIRRHWGGDGMLKMDNLEMLDIQWNEQLLIQCKSLKHCSLRDVVYGNAFSHFLQHHGTELISLVLYAPYFSRVDPRFYSQANLWQYLSNLRTLGITLDAPSWSVFRTPSPEQGYLLSNLYLTMENQEWIQGWVGQVQDKVKDMPWLRLLSINEGAFSVEEHAALEKFCGKLGIAYKTAVVN